MRNLFRYTPTVVGISLTLAFPAHANKQIDVQLTNPAIRLWYEGTGSLSRDIAPPTRFILWNTIIGEGDAEENADDALFTIDVRSDGEQNIPGALVLMATDSKGKVLGRRTFTNLLTDKSGNVTKPLWVRDIGCAGKVTFTAQFRGKSRSVVLDFACGE